MILPFRSENPLRHTPYLTRGIVAVNVVIHFVLTLWTPGLVQDWGAIPAHIWSVNVGTLEGWETLFTLISYGFFHGGLFHLAGNMIVLYAFAPSIENRLGPVRFVVFYLVALVLSCLSYAVVVTYFPSPPMQASLFRIPRDQIPLVGASGAVFAVMGAYFLKFPHTRIHTVFWVLIRAWVLRLPAYLILLYSIGLNLLLWYLSPDTNVAWTAHIAGFGIGLLGIGLLADFQVESRAQDEAQHSWREIRKAVGRMLRKEASLALLVIGLPLLMFVMGFAWTYLYPSYSLRWNPTFKRRVSAALFNTLNQAPLFLLLSGIILAVAWSVLRKRRLQSMMLLEHCLVCDSTHLKSTELDDYECLDCGFHRENAHLPKLVEAVEAMRESRFAEQYLLPVQQKLNNDVAERSLITFEGEDDQELFDSYQMGIEILRDFLQKHRTFLESLLPEPAIPGTEGGEPNWLDELSLVLNTPIHIGDGYSAKDEIETMRQLLEVLRRSLEALRHIQKLLQTLLLQPTSSPDV